MDNWIILWIIFALRKKYFMDNWIMDNWITFMDPSFPDQHSRLGETAPATRYHDAHTCTITGMLQ